MSKLLKVLFAVLGLGVVLIAAAVILIPVLIDPNDYKAQITEQIEKRTGRKFSLSGDIGLSVFPWLGVDLGAIALSDAPGFGDQPFVKSEHMQVRVKLLPLLRKAIEMDKVSLQGLELNLARDQSGRPNWADLLHKGQPAPEASLQPPPGGVPAEAGQEASPLAALTLGGVEIRNGRITWTDHQSGERYAAQGLNLATGAIAPDRPVELDLSFALEAPRQGLTGDIALESVVEFNLDARRYGLKGIDLSAKLKGQPLPGGATEIKLAAAGVDLDLKQNQAALSGLSLSAGGTPLSLDLASKRMDLDIASRTLALSEGKLTLNAENIVPVLKQLDVSNPGLEKLALRADAKFSGTGKTLAITPFHVKASLAGDRIPTAEVSLATRAEVDLDKQTLALNDLTLQGLGLDLKGAARAEELQKAPRLTGSFKLAPFDARKLLAQLGQKVPETADPKALTNIAMETSLSGSAKSLGLSDLVLGVDDTRLKGSLALADFSKPAIDFKLSVDSLDADRYLPSKKAGESTETPAQSPPRPATSGGAAGGAAAELPVEALRALNLRGNLGIGKLKLANATLTKVSLNIEAKDGQVKLAPLSADLYQGQYAGTVGLDVRGAQPVLSLNESLTGVQVEPLLRDLTGKARIAGATDLKARLTATGADAQALKRTLSGQAAFQFRDGALIGINLGQLVRLVEARKADAVGTVEESAKTDFSELKGSFTFAQGVASSQDLSMKSPLLRVAGQGQANLVTEQLDYVLNTTLSATAEGQGGKEGSELAGITIPIKMSGTFADPFKPDIEGMLRAKAEREIAKRKDKLQEKLQQKLQQKLQDLLR